ncbi:hypothetical protein HOO68_01810 [Candidatus Gracilibacteria bacterium]|nr:hypothetical protein [Candidatus Gracilibacteria bacterium]
MEIDLRTQHDNFVKMNFEEKRNFVASLLEEIKEGNELFTDLYNLIVSDVAIEQDFFDIFDSLVIVLYREEKDEEQRALNRLTQIRNSLELQKQQEAADNLQGQKEAQELLAGLV